MVAAEGISAPIFFHGGPLALSDSYLHERELVPTGPFTMTGPGETAEAGHLPVRGDLAHIRLAGRYFVPHYAAPMPRRIVTETRVCKTAQADGDCLEVARVGTVFNVLDIAGGWAWGQIGEDGFVGYVPVSALDGQ